MEFSLCAPRSRHTKPSESDLATVSESDRATGAGVWEGRPDPNKEGAMRRLITAVLLATGVLIVSPVADAAAPSFRDRIDDMYEIEDFCDSGVTVQAHEVTRAQGWETDTTSNVSFNSRTTYTYGDRSVSDHWAGRSNGLLVEGDLDGAHTVFFQEKGLRAYLKAPGIGTVTRDAGNLHFFISFSEDGPDEDEDPDFEDLEVVKDAGNHPDFYEPVWCTAALEILGIEAD